ncbi:MAG: polysaccharide biosynthesis/export family protein [Cyclobacteriaceae bacterium]
MFRIDETTELQQSIQLAERNYHITAGDRLRLVVSTNKGEQIIDPNFEFQQVNRQQNVQSPYRNIEYLVQVDGSVKLPMVGDVLLSGLTIDEAERKLQGLFDEFYKESFVRLSFLNKRVTVLGAVSNVVTLSDQNASLLEVLALSGAIQEGAIANNVRVIRGNLNQPEVFVVNLSTISTMQATMVDIAPGDIIYVEPFRRPVMQIVRDVNPFLGLFSSISSLAVLIISLNL